MINNLRHNDNGSVEISFESENSQEKRELLFLYDNYKDLKAKHPKTKLKLQVEKVKKSRTLDQNAFMWKLLHIYASEINGDRFSKYDVEELYVRQLKKYSTPQNILIRQDAVKDFVRQLQPRWHQIKGYTKGKDDKVYEYLEIYFGSSNFDTKEMGRLIDGILDDMQADGIDTTEVMKMTKEWEEFKELANEKHSTNG